MTGRGKEERTFSSGRAGGSDVGILSSRSGKRRGSSGGGGVALSGAGVGEGLRTGGRSGRVVLERKRRNGRTW